ncbi:hypothetical protein O1L68_05540 [Streptomyces lydicus]|nr:hypothetical protein [Streptomyces lydicus]
MHRALELIQGWLADERFASARLVVVTRHAVAVTGDEAIDLATAPVWGLLRSAQSEHPGLLLLDVDDDVRSLAAVADAIEAGTGAAGETGTGPESRSSPCGPAGPTPLASPGCHCRTPAGARTPSWAATAPF